MKINGHVVDIKIDTTKDCNAEISITVDGKKEGCIIKINEDGTVETYIDGGKY